MADITPADITEAVNALEQIDRVFRLFEKAKKAADVLRSFTNAKGELDVALAARRADLAALDAHTTDEAVARGKAIAAALLVDAETQKREIVASAQVEADKWAELVKQRRADLGNLQDEVTKIKAHAASLAG